MYIFKAKRKTMVTIVLQLLFLYLKNNFEKNRIIKVVSKKILNLDKKNLNLDYRNNNYFERKYNNIFI